ncbi:MAG: cobalamin-binding protein [Pseudomonadota bacterium]
MPVGIAGAAADTPLSLTDDRGRSMHLEHFARRIISLSPNITELVYAAGAGDRLVGVSSQSDYPAAAKSVPEIGGIAGLDLERIVMLKPDLVIAWRSGNAVADIDKLEKLGLPVFVTEATRLEDIPRLLRLTGQLAATSTQAESAARAYETELQQIKRSYAGRQRVSVFLLIWHQPLMTVNGNHIISDIINLCGGVNIFASASSLAPVISAESLLQADPQVIISSVLPEPEAGELWQQFPHIRAVRNKHLFFVHPDLLHRQTPRMLQAVKVVCEQLDRVRSG